MLSAFLLSGSDIGLSRSLTFWRTGLHSQDGTGGGALEREHPRGGESVPNYLRCLLCSCGLLRCTGLNYSLFHGSGLSVHNNKCACVFMCACVHMCVRVEARGFPQALFTLCLSCAVLTGSYVCAMHSGYPALHPFLSPAYPDQAPPLPQPSLPRFVTSGFVL